MKDKEIVSTITSTSHDTFSSQREYSARTPREVLVVGSVALDTVETPFGCVQEVLGGSATYFATAASMFTSVNLVAVVGTDFDDGHVAFLRTRGVNLEGLEVVPGKTFRWTGQYDYDLNTARTLDTQLNVFAEFTPKLPPSYHQPDLVFLANIDPELQLAVLDQVQTPDLVALDTMNYWIESKPGALREVISRVDIVMVNDAEAREFSGEYSLVQAARAILTMGPKAVVIKKGEYGASLYTNSNDPVTGYFFVPAYPLEEVCDPTGAGDTFAGGFIGALAQEPSLDLDALRRAIVHGSVLASVTVEDFSVNRLRSLTQAEIEERFHNFRAFTYFEPVPAPVTGE